MKPIETIRNKNISFTFWKRDKFVSFSLTKGFQDKEGNWRNQKIDMSLSDFKKILDIMLEADKKIKDDKI